MKGTHMITRNGMVWKFERRWERIPLSYYLRNAIGSIAKKFELAYGDYEWDVYEHILEARLVFKKNVDGLEEAIEALPKQIQTDTIEDNTGEIIERVR